MKIHWRLDREPVTDKKKSFKFVPFAYLYLQSSFTKYSKFEIDRIAFYFPSFFGVENKCKFKSKHVCNYSCLPANLFFSVHFISNLKANLTHKFVSFHSGNEYKSVVYRFHRSFWYLSAANRFSIFIWHTINRFTVRSTSKRVQQRLTHFYISL